MPPTCTETVRCRYPSENKVARQALHISVESQTHCFQLLLLTNGEPGISTDNIVGRYKLERRLPAARQAGFSSGPATTTATCRYRSCNGHKGRVECRIYRRLRTVVGNLHHAIVNFSDIVASGGTDVP